MTDLDIGQQRLQNQRLSGEPLSQPDEAVAWLAAVQSQDYAGAKWALGLRLSAATDATLDEAFYSGAILRTHVLRPTWHFVTPADIRWLLALTATRVHAVNATMYRKLDLDAATFQRSHAALVRALAGHTYLTRDELRDTLEQAGVAPGSGQRLAYLVMAAELDGLICSGPRRGKQFTYALLEERAPQARTLDREAALAELARRYFTSRGPATVQDFAKWSGLTIAEATVGLGYVKAGLDQTVVGGQTLFFRPPSATRPTWPQAHLLSIYDEYISSYRDRGAIVAEDFAARLWALGNGLSYILVLDGQVVGTWRRDLRKDAVVVEMTPFRPLIDAEQRAVSVALQQYEAFLRLPVEVVWT